MKIKSIALIFVGVIKCLSKLRLVLLIGTLVTVLMPSVACMRMCRATPDGWAKAGTNDDLLLTKDFGQLTVSTYGLGNWTTETFAPLGLKIYNKSQ
jgi:hypothetical protein